MHELNLRKHKWTCHYSHCLTLQDGASLLEMLVEIIRFVVGLLGPEAKPFGNHWRKPGDRSQLCA